METRLLTWKKTEMVKGLPGARAAKRAVTYSVYNDSRRTFLGLNVTCADTSFMRLKGLLGRIRLKMGEGLWVVPSRGIHTIGLLFPIDVVYLDSGNRVIHVVEHMRTFRFSRISLRGASVLELPAHTIYASETRVGDQLTIHAAGDEDPLGHPAPVGAESRNQ